MTTPRQQTLLARAQAARCPRLTPTARLLLLRLASAHDGATVYSLNSGQESTLNTEGGDEAVRRDLVTQLVCAGYAAWEFQPILGVGRCVLHLTRTGRTMADDLRSLLDPVPTHD